MTQADYQAAMGKGGKYETHLYYRRPDRGEHRRWIVVGMRSALEDMSLRGFEPLFKYGRLEKPEAATAREQGKDVYVWDQWRPILQHPDGPAEFPAEQVMTLRWYKECPVPGTVFPQLAGHKLKERQCPECTRAPFLAIDGLGGVEALGRHLRLIHSWDRASLVKYGERVGIDFDAIYSNIEEDIDFDTVAQEAKPPPEEPSDGIVAEFDCDECDWKPKPRAKSRGQALIMHKRHAHPVAVPA